MSFIEHGIAIRMTNIYMANLTLHVYQQIKKKVRLNL
jgi:hypothetical protein